MKELTARQKLVLGFIKDFISENKVSPTFIDIAKGMFFDSPNAAQYHVNVLKQKGYINTTPNVARSIVVLTGDNGWISVNDRLPEYAALHLLCLSVHGKVYAANYYAFDEEFYAYSHSMDSTPIGVVTHWQEQPKPPIKLIDKG